MSTVAASLQQRPGFQVQEIEGKSSDTVDRLEAAPPDVILFSLSEAQPGFAVLLLRNHCRMLLVEVDLMNTKCCCPSVSNHAS